METQPIKGVQKCAVDVIFWIHFIIFLFFPLGFFIPSAWWPARIDVHFWYSVSLFVLFYLWGAIWTIKRRDRVYSICMLDTLMQRMRGYSLWDPKNYDHSFVEELFARFHLKQIKNEAVPGLLLICIALSGLFYFLKLNGIVLY